MVHLGVVAHLDCFFERLSQPSHQSPEPTLIDNYYAEFHFSKGHNAECQYAECHYAEWLYAKCSYAECLYSKSRYAECR